MENEKSNYTGVTGYELAEMLNKKSDYSENEALDFISSLEKKYE